MTSECRTRAWWVRTVLWLFVVGLPVVRVAQAQLLADPVPRLSIVKRGDGIPAITWNDLGPAYGYTLEMRDLNGASAWVPVPASVWPITETSWVDLYPLAGPARFYRLATSTRSAQRGQLLAAGLLESLSTSNIQAIFSASNIPLTPERPVDAQRIVYESENPFHAQTSASGLVVHPQHPTNALPLVCYHHGTIVTKAEAPSSLHGLEVVVGLGFATSGYVAVLPDYLGLGDSPGLHPYLHAESEAASAIDLIRAARMFCATNQIPLNGQVFLIGYSQGGHATMATQRAIESRLTNEFQITASAPMAGPYSLSEVTFNDFLSDRSMPNPYYFLYLLGAFESVYHIAPSFRDILVSPFDVTLPALLDGVHSEGDLNRVIGTSSPKQLLKPEFLAAVQADPNHPMRVALRANDLIDWTPQAPTRLYHCGGDKDVLFANSQAAYDSFVRRGAKNVELLGEVLPLDHGGCAPLTLLAAKVWFDSLVVH